MNWGDRRESTFKDDADGQRWLERLESAAPRANCIRTGVIRERHHERKEGCAVEDGEGDDDGWDCAKVVDGMPAYVGKLFEEVMAYSPIAGTDTFPFLVLMTFHRVVFGQVKHRPSVGGLRVHVSTCLNQQLHHCQTLVSLLSVISVRNLFRDQCQCGVSFLRLQIRVRAVFQQQLHNP